jgi:hypothetical protein
LRDRFVAFPGREIAGVVATAQITGVALGSTGIATFLAAFQLAAPTWLCDRDRPDHATFRSGRLCGQIGAAGCRAPRGCFLPRHRNVTARVYEVTDE